MARILWASEQPIRPTGYATVSREVIKRLIKDYGHEIHVIGWDYNGEPFPHPEGWTLLHAGLNGFGAEKLNHSDPESPTVLDQHLADLKPDLYLSLIDCWFIGHAVLSCNRTRTPYIAYTPVDGFPLSYQWGRILGNLHTPLWMANYGKEQFEAFVSRFSAKVGDAPSEMLLDDLDRFVGVETPMIWHGVDSNVFKPMSMTKKEQGRKALGIEWETVFLSVGRNGNRKQIPRLLDALRLVLDRNPDANIGLILHCGDPTDSMGLGGWNLPELVKSKGLLKNVQFSDATSNPLYGLSREDMATLYGISDVHVLATGGEGFGIPSAEAMSCGIPIILPDNSTGPELVGEGDERGWLVPCTTTITGPKWGVNMSLVDVEALADAMWDAHKDVKGRMKKGKAGRQFIEANMDWDIIAKQFHELIEATIERQKPLGME
jgi:glycosyltransferase involved in cell wall biosynthesis